LLDAAFDGADPLDYFAACHAATRTRCSLLEQLVSGNHDLASPVSTAQIDGIVRFFEGPARAHHEDEELFFFPFLCQLRLNQDQRLDLISLIASLAGDHRELDTLWREMRATLQVVRDGGVRDVRAIAATFVATHRHHMNREDTGVLPVARRYLDQQSLRTIGTAIAERQRRLASGEARGGS
jgi:hemerythrin-like domain-containing protein